MKKLIAGLIGALLLSGGVLFANNIQPAKRMIRSSHPSCTHCTKTTCSIDSKQAAATDCKGICPDKAYRLCPSK